MKSDRLHGQTAEIEHYNPTVDFRTEQQKILISQHQLYCPQMFDEPRASDGKMFLVIKSDKRNRFTTIDSRDQLPQLNFYYVFDLCCERSKGEQCLSIKKLSRREDITPLSSDSYFQHKLLINARCCSLSVS